MAEAAKADIQEIAKAYLDSIVYKLDESPLFTDKLPENHLYLGFIAKAFPHAKIINLHRNPMDSCFALYKQSYFRYAYNFSDLAEYYLAYNKLNQYWHKVLRDRIIDVRYESLVADQINQTKIILEKLGLRFEENCLHFHKNPSATASASASQVRQKIYSDSVNKWKKFSAHLGPLKELLEKGGIDTSH